MPSEIEIEAVASALSRLFGAAALDWRRKEAIEILTAAEKARRMVGRATQIPPAEGERQICRCPACGRNHWKKDA